MHQNSSPISYVPIGVSNRVNVLSNFSVQFWFLQFLLCFGQDYVWLSFKLTHLTACHPSQWSKITISISGDALNFISSFMCPKRVSNRLKFSSNFCVQFWFLQFHQCFVFRTRLCVIILLSLFLSFATCWFSPLGLFFIIVSWSWHGRLIIQVSVFPKGFNGFKVPSIICVHSDFCIFFDAFMFWTRLCVIILLSLFLSLSSLCS